MTQEVESSTQQSTLITNKQKPKVANEFEDGKVSTANKANSKRTKSTFTPLSPRRIQRGVREYLLGLLLQPWIWTTGYIIITAGGIITLFLRNSPFLYATSIRIPGELSFVTLWLISVLLLLVNYTCSFFIKYRAPRLVPLFFLVSLNVLLVFLVVFAQLLI